MSYLHSTSQIVVEFLFYIPLRMLRLSANPFNNANAIQVVTKGIDMFLVQRE